MDMIKRPSRSHDEPQTDKDDVAIGDFEKQLIERVRNKAVERKHRLTILTYLGERARNDLELFCKQKSIGYMSIVFAGKFDDLTISKEDPHWNVQANKLIADQISSHFELRINK